MWIQGDLSTPTGPTWLLGRCSSTLKGTLVRLRTSIEASSGVSGWRGYQWQLGSHSWGNTKPRIRLPVSPGSLQPLFTFISLILSTVVIDGVCNWWNPLLTSDTLHNKKHDLMRCMTAHCIPAAVVKIYGETILQRILQSIFCYLFVIHWANINIRNCTGLAFNRITKSVHGCI